MSCQYKNLASILDIEYLKKCLFLVNKDTSVPSDPWDWSVQEDDSEKPVIGPGTSWLEECCVSLSPTGELLVITHKQCMVILTSKWDSQEESGVKTKYCVTWYGDPSQEPNETITAALCLPLAASPTSRTAHCVADWTCIALGFSSGALRFYTETGSLLLSEVLHEGPIIGIKCQSHAPPRHTSCPEMSEELHVNYKGVVCSLYGFALSNTLRACRNQLARVQANCEEMITAPPLSLHKWSLPDQDNMVDCSVGLPQCPPGFSHLATASLCGGFNTWYRPSPPQSSLVIAAGNKPYVGFHYVVEGNTAPVLTDVAIAVASKLKSAFGQAVPSWFLGGRKNSPQPEKAKKKLTLEPAEPMVCRFGLCDLWRQGCSIVMSPYRNLCVVSDTLGRVTLIDNNSGIALRMWKGYRDAQCGWVTAEEERQSGSDRKRSALFLVIYAPKKGIIEVWAMQQGPRVATFQATKYGRLLYTDYGLLGISSLGTKGPNKSLSPCVFVDESGVLKELRIPFHCTLSDKNSKRARDIHLLKKLKACLREGNGENGSDGIAIQCKELRTNEMREQALDILCSTKRVSVQTLLEVVEGFIQSLDNPDCEGLDPAGKAVLSRCQQLQKLLLFYQFTSSLQQKPPNYDSVVADDSNNDIQSLCDFLRTTKHEVKKLLALVNSVPNSNSVRVTFQDRPEGLPGFLSGFQLNSASSETVKLTNCSLLYISDVACQGSLNNISEWQEAAKESNIDAGSLMKLCLTYWLNKNTRPSIPEIIGFGNLLKAVGKIAGSSVYDESWWNDVRALLKESSSTLPAISAAFVCRTVALTYEEPSVMTESMETDNEGDGDSKPNNDWEKITQDSCMWSQLISQLEDICAVNSVIKKKPVPSTHPVLQCLEYEQPEVSVSSVLLKGKGCISELVAKWIAGSGIDPTLLLEEPPVESNKEPPKRGLSSIGVEEGVPLDYENSVEAKPVTHQQTELLEDLANLREHFPHSLAGNVLLANLCWEYVLAWSRDVDKLPFLQSALICLSTVPSAHLKQGICTMLWSMHLRLRFEAAIRLINKIGKVPKERLCRQDIGLSDIQMTDFFRFCSDFFDIFMESNVLSEVTTKQTFSSETLWEGSSVPPLHQLALGQPAANYDILHLLSQCSRAMYLLAVFNLKSHRPLNSFFDAVGQSALFADVHARVQLPGHSLDVKLTEGRMHFLLKAVAAATSSITVHNMEYNTKQAVDWMSQCLALAADWSIPADPLRRQQVCELYARGYDRLAEEVIPAVSERNLLGSHLLVIAGKRMKRSLKTSSNEMKERITNLSPALTTWMQSLDEDNEEETSLAETCQLAITVLSLLEEDDHENRRLARLLVDSLQAFLNAGNRSA